MDTRVWQIFCRCGYACEEINIITLKSGVVGFIDGSKMDQRCSCYNQAKALHETSYNEEVAIGYSFWSLVSMILRLWSAKFCEWIWHRALGMSFYSMFSWLSHWVLLHCRYLPYPRNSANPEQREAEKMQPAFCYNANMLADECVPLSKYHSS